MVVELSIAPICGRVGWEIEMYIKVCYIDEIFFIDVLVLLCFVEIIISKNFFDFYTSIHFLPKGELMPQTVGEMRSILMFAIVVKVI